MTRRRCDRCRRRTWLGVQVTGDWRTFCPWCLLAAAWEKPQPTEPGPGHREALTITVIDHAVEQAAARYPAAVSAHRIAADVAEALDEGRVGNHLMRGGIALRGAKHHSRLAWTHAGERIYVWRYTAAGRVLVITALPPVQVDGRWHETTVARALRKAMVA